MNGMHPNAIKMKSIYPWCLMRGVSNWLRWPWGREGIEAFSGHVESIFAGVHHARYALAQALQRRLPCR